MVVRQLDPDEVDRVFAALADATLARSYAMSFAAVQKHVAVLERAHLVTKQRHGREQVVHPDVATIRAAARLLDRYEEIWRGRIDRITEILGDTREGDAS
jgi:DNA-binding transcriptional ArsR family regulator